MTTRPSLGERLSYACTPEPLAAQAPLGARASRTTLAERDPARARRLTQGLRPLESYPEAMAVIAAPPPATVLADPPPTAAPRTARGFRGNSIFHRHGAFDWRILDRNQRAKLWSVAQSMERITKQKGDRNGCLGAIGLSVLNCLLFRFLNAGSGRCDPSYDTLQKLTGLCRQSISTAIDRLEAAGLVAVTRRIMRFKQRVTCALTGRHHDIVVVRQISNAYVLTDPARLAIPNRAAAKPSRAFPKRWALSALETLNAALAGIVKTVSEPSLPDRGKLKQSVSHPLSPRYEVRVG
jgi:Helix-turn-helix domain